MPKELSDKDNLLRAITRANPDRIPVRRMDGVIPGMVKVYYHGSRPMGSGADRWGVRWAGGAPPGREWEPLIQPYAVGHPLADLSELEDFSFPDPGEPGIMDGLLTGLDRKQALILGELPFLLLERAHLLAGMEALFVAMATDPDAVRRLLRQIADYQITIVQRYIDLGVDAIRGQDDYGAQNSLLISPQMWRKLIKPELGRIYTVAKEAGLLVFHHTCGHIMEIVPDLIELGVDVLDSVQAHANDQAQLKHLYGSDLSFMGGVDTQYVLSQGTPEEVEAEVKRCVRCLGSSNGYIMGPDNLIPITERNYRAYLSAGERYSRYPLAI